MRALMKQNRFSEALSLYEEGKNLKNGHIYSLAVKCCQKLNDFDAGKRIISSIDPKNTNVFLSTALIDFFGHFGDIRRALNVFDSVQKREKNAICIGSMMKALNKNKKFEQSLLLHENYSQINNDVTHLLALIAAKKCNDYEKGLSIHKSIDLRSASIELQNALIGFYGHFGQIEESQKIFDWMAKRNETTSNAMMSVLVSHSLSERALFFYDCIEQKTQILHILAVKVCAKTKNIRKGKEIDLATKTKSKELKNSLIAFYGKVGQIGEAQRLFYDDESERDAVSVNNLMSAFMNARQFEHALALYDEFEQFLCDETTHLFALQSCQQIGNYDKGRVIGCKMKKKDVQSQNALIAFCGSAGDLRSAQVIFDGLGSDKNVISVNCAMTAFINNECAHRALALYDDAAMHLIDRVSHTLAIRGCIMTDNPSKGQKICTQLQMDSNFDILLQTAMIDFYGHFGDALSAKSVFDSIGDDEKNVNCVNAMMEAYYCGSLQSECIRLFEQHKSVADKLSFAILFKACADSTLFAFGCAEHERLRESNGAICKEKEVQTNLIRMYAECGEMAVCEQLFAEFRESENCKEADVWCAMLSGYGINGQMEKMNALLNEMKNFGICRNEKVYASLISTYAHFGQLDKAQRVWNEEIGEEHLKFNRFVVTSGVDCFARNGLLHKAKNLILEYEQYSKNAHHASMWSSLLSACCKFRETDMAKKVYQQMQRRFDKNLPRMKSAAIKMENMKQQN